jgi:AcrR family transcriptional regulator
MSGGDAGAKRPYRMQARARATEATRVAILEAAEVAFDELPFGEITLAEIGKRAGVSVQTILRHFESKEGLLLASLLHTGAKMAPDREVLPIGDLGEIVGVLVDHYEKFGDRLLRSLAQEDREPTLRRITDLGRAFHLEWCKQAFSPALRGLRGAKRVRRLAQFATGTDVYVWKLLRRDRGLSRRQTELGMRELLEPLMKARR